LSRIEHKTGGFQYGHPQERLFILAGEDQGSSRGLAMTPMTPEADREVLGAVGQLLKRRPTEKFPPASALAGTNVSVAPVSTKNRPSIFRRRRANRYFV
jgi:hypothetical protein